MSVFESLAEFAKSHLSEFEWEMTKDAAKVLIGSAAGWTLKATRDRWRTRRARAFWRPFLSDDLRLVIGRFVQMRHFDLLKFERSGVLGVGDAVAFAELQRYLSQIGGSPQLAYADRLEGDALKHTMILLGGPDANSVTRRTAKRITSMLRFGNPEVNEIAIRDTSEASPRLYVPSPLDRDNAGTDYGLILRAPNPFAPDKEIMIIAGSFGYGTWAAARHVTSIDFLARSASLQPGPMECLVETDVELDTPQRIRQVLLRTFVQKT